MIRSARLTFFALGFSVLAGAAAAQTCPEHSAPYRVDTTNEGTVTHCGCVAGYKLSNGACQPVTPAAPVAPAQATGPSAACMDATRRLADFKSQLENQNRQAAANRAFMDEWTKQGQEGLKKLALDSLAALAGSLGAASKAEAQDFDELRAHANEIRALAQKHPTNVFMYSREIRLLQAQMDPVRTLALTNKAAETYRKGRLGWVVFEQSMHNGFRTGAAASARFNALLNQDPEIRRALAGSPGDNPQYEMFSAIAKRLVGDASTLAARYSRYAKIAGPTARIANFVFDAAYDDALIFVSADRVDQANTTAGNLARAAGILQKDYQNAVDAKLASCPPVN